MPTPEPPLIVRSTERAAEDFQKPVSAADIVAICRQTFGRSAEVTSAVELSGGLYNSTYRVGIRGAAPVILRVAPAPSSQSRLEHQLMRNEYASIPHLAPIAELMPQTLAADFRHQVIGRDYLLQTYLDGVPAAEGLTAFPRELRSSFWRELGQILARVHAVPGSRFGRIHGASYGSWSAAVAGTFSDIAKDLDDAGLDSADIRQLSGLAEEQRTVLDEIGQPRLLHGDLWIGNVMLAADSPTPRITGVFDCDRTSWGDPMADWTMFLTGRLSEQDAGAFWIGYGGAPREAEGALVRSLFYQARSLGEARLEYHRLHQSERAAHTYAGTADIIAALQDRQRTVGRKQ